MFGSGTALQPAYPPRSAHEPLEFTDGPPIPSRKTETPDVSKQLKAAKAKNESMKKELAMAEIKLKRKDSFTKAQHDAHEKRVRELQEALTKSENQIQEFEDTMVGLEASLNEKTQQTIADLEKQVRVCEDRLNKMRTGKTTAGREPEVDPMKTITYSGTYNTADDVKPLWVSFSKYQQGYFNRSPSQRIDVYASLRKDVSLLVNTLNDAFSQKEGFHDTMLNNLDRIVFLLWFCAACYQPCYLGDFMLLRARKINDTAEVIQKYNQEPENVSNEKMKEMFEYHSNGIPKFYNDHQKQAKGGDSVGIQTPLLEPISSTNSFLYDGSHSKFTEPGEYPYRDPNCHGWRDGFNGMHRLRARLGLFEKKDWFDDGVLERMSQHLINAEFLSERGILGRRMTEVKLANFLITKGINDLPPPSYKKEESYAGTSRRVVPRTTRHSSSSKRPRRRRSRQRSRRRSPSRGTR